LKNIHKCLLVLLQILLLGLLISCDSAEKYFAEGSEYLTLGEYKKAIEAFLKSTEIEPNNAEAYFNLGAAYVHLGKTEKAIEAFLKSIEIEPNNAEAYFNLGISYASLGMTDKEIVSYSEAIDINSNYTEAYFNLGAAYASLGMYEEAVEAYINVTNNTPNNAEAYFNLGAAYVHLGKTEKAIEAFLKSIEITPKFSRAYYMLGAIYYIQEDYEKTQNIFKQLKELDYELYSELRNRLNYGSKNVDLVIVKGDSFQMGSSGYNVKLTYDYYIGKYEITNSEFLEFLNAVDVSSDGIFKGYQIFDMTSFFSLPDIEKKYGKFVLKDIVRENFPVSEVPWRGAMEYCNWLSEKEGFPVAYNQNGDLVNKNGNVTADITEVEGYRLPTEAEWEFAAKGGRKSQNYEYSGSNNISEVAWYYINAVLQRHEVGQKKPNELELFDMSGNVWEWCTDYWNKDYFKNSPLENPVTTLKSIYRVVRGGSWSNYARQCKTTFRGDYGPENSDANLGFRIARTK